MLYKKLIQRKMMSLKRSNPRFKNVQIAERLEIEPSYLSRFLSDDKVNFSQALVFRLLTELQMNKIQIDQILTLRELELTTSPELKMHLKENLQAIRIQNVSNKIALLKEELNTILEMLGD